MNGECFGTSNLSIRAGGARKSGGSGALISQNQANHFGNSGMGKKNLRTPGLLTIPKRDPPAER